MYVKQIIAAGGLVFNPENELLMIYRRGVWDLPKGKLDEGDTIEQCAVREVEEETGLKDIRLGKLIGITLHEYFDTWSNSEVIKETHWFEMHITDKQQLIPQTEEDITQTEWVNAVSAVEHLQNSYKNIIEIVNKSGFAAV